MAVITVFNDCRIYNREGNNLQDDQKVPDAFVLLKSSSYWFVTSDMHRDHTWQYIPCSLIGFGLTLLENHFCVME
jgi:hypothetical protein